MRLMSVTALLTISALTLPALAQVHKCKDADGKIIYTDAPCASNQSGALIERQRTQSEIYQERSQAAQAENRKQAQRLAQQQREWAAQSQRVEQPQGYDSGNDWAARNAQRNAQVGASSITNNDGKWDQAAQRERIKQAQRDAAAMPAPATPQPTNITRCSSGFCHDNTGGVYHRVGPNSMTDANGRSCHRNGSALNCN